jgi:hypothetical protein
MPGWVIKHVEIGFLSDFDPFGKQEFCWVTDRDLAWVFPSVHAAKAALRWLPKHVKANATINETVSAPTQ